MYTPESYPNRYWTGPRNTTAWSVFMAELTRSGNAIAELMLKDLAPQLHGAHLGQYDAVSESLDVVLTSVMKAYLTRTRCSRTCSTIHNCT